MKYLIICITILFISIIGCNVFNGNSEEPESPIPGKIVFSMPQSEEGSNQIYVMNPNGTELKQLTDFGQFGATEPSWSPDGGKIVFTTSKSGTVGNNAIYIMNADGSDPHPMKVFPERPDLAFTGQYPKWSPDGTKIAYSQCLDCGGPGGNNSEIFIYDFETDSITQITDHPATDMNPVWSPDGSRLLFNSDRVPTNSNPIRSDIFIMDFNGLNVQRITSHGNAGRQIFINQGKELIYWYDNSLYKMDLDNRDIDQISVNLPNEIGFRPVGASPNGSEILLHSFNLTNTKEDYSLRLLDSITGKIQVLDNRPRFTHFDWYYSEEN